MRALTIAVAVALAAGSSGCIFFVDTDVKQASGSSSGGATASGSTASSSSASTSSASSSSSSSASSSSSGSSGTVSTGGSSSGSASTSASSSASSSSGASSSSSSSTGSSSGSSSSSSSSSSGSSGSSGASVPPPWTCAKPGFSGFGYSEVTNAAGVQWVRLADFDGDGKLDAVVASPSSVVIYYGAGDGGFDASHSIGGSNPVSGLAVADVDRNGAPDVIISTGSNPQDIVLLENPRRSQTPFLVSLSQNNATSTPVAADFDRDGRVDLAWTLPNAGVIGVQLQAPSGGFATSVKAYGLTGTPQALVVGDFDHDGWPDLAAAYRQGSDAGVVDILYNLHDGGFGNFGTLGAAATYAGCPDTADLAAADVDGDGQLDILIACRSLSQVQVLTNPTFAAAVAASLPYQPSSLAAADLDRDGFVDLAVGNAGSSPGVAVLLNDRTGHFVDAGLFQAPGSGNAFSPLGLAAGDMNGDGRADLVGVDGLNGILASHVSEGVGTGDGGLTFLSGGSVDDPHRLAVSDLNHDGLPDVIAPALYAQEFDVLFGLSSGGLDAPALFAANDYANVAVTGDFDRDGFDDVLIGSGYSGTLNPDGGVTQGGLTLFPSQLGTSFAPQATYLANVDVVAAAVGDLDRDGWLDTVAVGHSSPTLYELLWNPSTGSFNVTSIDLTPAGANYLSGVALGDFNGDGSLDVAVADQVQNVVWILLNDGAGNLGPATGWPATGALGIAVGDVNGDGKPDLAVADFGEGEVNVLLGRPDGGFGPTTKHNMATSIIGVSLVDLNGDGKPDIAACGGGPYLSILYNRNGTFGSIDGGASEGAVYSLPGASFWLTSLDLNRDGLPDLVITDNDNNKLVEAVNTCQ